MQLLKLNWITLRWTRATRYVTPVVLYIKVDARCDKLATGVSIIKIIIFK